MLCSSIIIWNILLVQVANHMVQATTDSIEESKTSTYTTESSTPSHASADPSYVSHNNQLSTRAVSMYPFAPGSSIVFVTNVPADAGGSTSAGSASTTNLVELKTLLKRLVERMCIFEKKKRSLQEKPLKRKKKEHGEKRKWGDWTDWSGCSVTCGRGRKIKWRQCEKNCHDVETEMLEKTCQLPACESKLFGIIKL